MGRFINMLAATIPLLAATLAMGEGTIVGSKHDFSSQNFSDGAICKPCHTPHNADITVTGRLWAHTMSQQVTYQYHGTRLTPADGTTTGDGANGTITAATDLDGASRLCLSCHDGTVALDSFMGSNHTVSDGRTLTGDANLGTNLSNDHPVGLKALIADYKPYYKPAVNIATKLKLVKTSVAYAVGGTDVYGTPLTGNEYAVSCVTCHDVHNGKDVDGGVGLLRVSNAGSALCLTCHNK